MWSRREFLGGCGGAVISTGLDPAWAQNPGDKLPVPPLAPSMFGDRVVVGARAAELWWNEVAAARYDLLRTEFGNVETQTLLENKKPGFIDTGLWANMRYSWQVRAVDAIGTSAWSAPLVRATSLDEPLGFSVRANPNQAQCTIEWRYQLPERTGSANSIRIELQRLRDNAPPRQFGDNLAIASTATDVGYIIGDQYQLRFVCPSPLGGNALNISAWTTGSISFRGGVDGIVRPHDRHELINLYFHLGISRI